MTIRGGCLCGCLLYEINGELSDVALCHCSRCRRALGGAFGTYARIAEGAFRWKTCTSLVAMYESSPGVNRCFCGCCGSPMGVVVGEGHELNWVSLGSVSGDPGVRPEANIFVGSKAPWFEVADDLPQFNEWPPVTSAFYERFD